MKWTPSRVTRLKKLLKAGYSHKQIGDKMGTTASSVKGKICKIVAAQKGKQKPEPRPKISIPLPVEPEPIPLKRPPAVYSNVNFYEETLKRYA